MFVKDIKGIELDENMLDEVSGGINSYDQDNALKKPGACPKCGGDIYTELAPFGAKVDICSCCDYIYEYV